jgi:CRP-like cAMP-binding protein
MAGVVDDNIYHVESGLLRSYVLVNEDEQIIRFGYQGDFVVAMDSFFTGQPTMLYAEALRKTTVRIIKRAKYEEAIRTDSELNKIWQKILSWMVMGQLEREIDLLTNDPAERYRRVLERSPRLFQEVPAKYIANYLRMTAETLSRLKGR